jgi:hypothetical protein
MARVNVSMPDELHEQARRAGLNISQLTQRAVGDELDRLAKIAALDAYLTELEAQLGPVDRAEQAEAATWADRVFGQEPRRSSA